MRMLNTDSFTASTFAEADGNMTFDESMMLNMMMESCADLGIIDASTAEPYNKLYEIREEYNAALQEINILELAQLVNGHVAIYEAMADGSSLWTKFIAAAKTFFSRMLEALTMIWNWASRMLDKYVSANALFVSKYEKLLKGVRSVTFANGYKFGDIKAPTVYKINVPDKLDRDNPIDPDKVALEKDKIITTITNGEVTGNVTNPAQAIHEKYYGTLFQSPDTVYDVQKQLEFIKSCKSDQKNITVPFKKAVIEMKALAYSLSKFSALQSAEDSKQIMHYVELSKYNVEVLYAAYTQYVKAVIDRTNQARAICIKALQDKLGGTLPDQTQQPTSAPTTEAFVTSRRPLSEMNMLD